MIKKIVTSQVALFPVLLTDLAWLLSLFIYPICNVFISLNVFFFQGEILGFLVCPSFKRASTCLCLWMFHRSGLVLEMMKLIEKVSIQTSDCSNMLNRGFQE